MKGKVENPTEMKARMEEREGGKKGEDEAEKGDEERKQKKGCIEDLKKMMEASEGQGRL